MGFTLEDKGYALLSNPSFYAVAQALYTAEMEKLRAAFIPKLPDYAVTWVAGERREADDQAFSAALHNAEFGAAVQRVRRYKSYLIGLAELANSLHLDGVRDEFKVAMQRLTLAATDALDVLASQYRISEADEDTALAITREHAFAELRAEYTVALNQLRAAANLREADISGQTDRRFEAERLAAAEALAAHAREVRHAQTQDRAAQDLDAERAVLTDQLETSRLRGVVALEAAEAEAAFQETALLPLQSRYETAEAQATAVRDLAKSEKQTAFLTASTDIDIAKDSGVAAATTVDLQRDALISREHEDARATLTNEVLTARAEKTTAGRGADLAYRVDFTKRIEGAASIAHESVIADLAVAEVADASALAEQFIDAVSALTVQFTRERGAQTGGFELEAAERDVVRVHQRALVDLTVLADAVAYEIGDKLIADRAVVVARLIHTLDATRTVDALEHTIRYNDAAAKATLRVAFTEEDTTRKNRFSLAEARRDISAEELVSLEDSAAKEAVSNLNIDAVGLKAEKAIEDAHANAAIRQMRAMDSFSLWKRAVAEDNVMRLAGDDLARARTVDDREALAANERLESTARMNNLVSNMMAISNERATTVVATTKKRLNADLVGRAASANANITAAKEAADAASRLTEELIGISSSVRAYRHDASIVLALAGKHRVTHQYEEMRDPTPPPHSPPVMYLPPPGIGAVLLEVPYEVSFAPKALV